MPYRIRFIDHGGYELYRDDELIGKYLRNAGPFHHGYAIERIEELEKTCEQLRNQLMQAVPADPM